MIVYLILCIFHCDNVRTSIDTSKLEKQKTHHLQLMLEDGTGRLSLLLTISGILDSTSCTDITNSAADDRERQEREHRYVSNVSLFSPFPKDLFCRIDMNKLLDEIRR